MGLGGGRRNCGDYCEKFARYIVIGINVIFFVLGCVIVGLAAKLLTATSALQDNVQVAKTVLADLNVVIIAYIFVACGCAIVVISLAGAIGAWKQYRKALIFYAASMFLVLTIQFAMGIYLNGVTASQLEAKWHSSQPETRDEIQKFLICCGFNQIGDTAPYPDCAYSGPDWPIGGTQTCHKRGTDYINSIIVPASVGAIVIAALEFTSMFATCGLIYSSRDLKPGDDFFGTSSDH